MASVSLQMINAGGIVLVFNADTHPYVILANQFDRSIPATVQNASSALGIDANDALPHHLKDFQDKAHRNLIMEQITH